MPEDSGPEGRHGFSQLWLGPKALFLTALAFLGTVLAAGGWFLEVKGPSELPEGASSWLIYPMAAVHGLLYGSGVLLACWFAGYFLQEAKEMIAERYKEARFRAGEAQGLTRGRSEGLTEGRSERDREWSDYLARRSAAEQAGETFTEPTPAERAAAAGAAAVEERS